MNVLVVWCESPHGHISTRVDEQDNPIVYESTDLVDIPVCWDLEDSFAILGKKDGMKIAIPTGQVSEVLGWEF